MAGSSRRAHPACPPVHIAFTLEKTSGNCSLQACPRIPGLLLGRPCPTHPPLAEKGNPRWRTRLSTSGSTAPSRRPSCAPRRRSSTDGEPPTCRSGASTAPPPTRRPATSRTACSSRCSRCPDPIRGGNNVLVMCEVLYIDMTPHKTNTRAKCAAVAAKYADQESIFGIEQEYTFFKDGRPYGFPFGGFPAPQGGYYCGVGADEVYGRDIVEEHMDACLDGRPAPLRHQRRGDAGPVGVPDRPGRRPAGGRRAVDRPLAALPHRRGPRRGRHARPEAREGRLERRRRSHELLDEGDARGLRPDHRRVRVPREAGRGARRRSTATASRTASPASTRPRRTRSTATACRTAARRCASRGRSRWTRRATSRIVAPTPTATRTRSR